MLYQHIGTGKSTPWVACNSTSHFHHGCLDSSPSSCHLWMVQVIENVTPHLPEMDNISAHESGSRLFGVLQWGSNYGFSVHGRGDAWSHSRLIVFSDHRTWELGSTFSNVNGCNNLETLTMLNGFGLCHRIICCNQSLNGLVPILMNLVMVFILALSSVPRSVMLKQTNPLQEPRRNLLSALHLCFY